MIDQPMSAGRRLAQIQAAKKRPPPDVKGDWDTKQPREKMPGPNAPDPKSGNGVLGTQGARNGAYALPGLGEWARARNRQRYRDSHAFNQGPDSRSTNSA